ncbi:MAG TPA: zinc ribbon domain-containing protein, partial [Candidatus Lokiarchaeia archaeon]|nr:zinc ribbon domain-containing protein [Candidatus Lokiarchaeia archaeon]
SQECAACGATVSKKLWERVHACPYCGFVIDRDTNSSLVILKRGMGRTPKPVELALLRRVAGASAGAETGTLIENHCIILQ